MRIRKAPIRSDRLRRPPPEGWSWLDRRFLREFAEPLPPDAVVLYFFLAAVSDKDGLSYYSDTGIAQRLKMREASVAAARAELEFHDLIAYEAPLYQVLSLPERRGRTPKDRSDAGPASNAEIFRHVARERGAGREQRRA